MSAPSYREEREPRGAEGQRKGMARPGTGWDGEGQQRSGGGGAKVLQLNGESRSPKQPPRTGGGGCCRGEEQQDTEL